MQLWFLYAPSSVRSGDWDLDRDHRERIQGLAAWLNAREKSDLRVFLRSTEPTGHRGGIAGASWMLGAELALRATELALPATERGERETLLHLGAEWIVTGALERQEKVVPVGMAGKTELDLPRRWLIPAANEPDLPPRFRTRYAGRIGLVVDVESAWRQLTGTGTQRERPTEQWPQGDEVEALHGLVSAAVRPLIASILYTRPRRIVLWHSKETKEMAEMVVGVVEQLKQRKILCADCEAEPMEMDASDLVKAEQDLRSRSEFTHLGNCPTLFNITGGNMLMKYAVINLAALNPSLWLLYRDASDAGSHDFVRLRTLGTQFATSPLRGNEDATIKWNFLFGFSRDDSQDSLVKGILGEE